VAVNKNTGIETLLFNNVERLFLSDDDTWPVHPHATELHLKLGYGHSMVAWGRHRKISDFNNPRMPKFTSWSWPRGVVLYVDHRVVNKVGGMIEAFGPGGHEHVEWSRRISQAKFTPFPFITPLAYGLTEDGGMYEGIGARDYWHCEDMQQRGETMMSVKARREALTSVRRRDGDWTVIDKIMKDRDGDTSFVPYAAAENGRASATFIS
jgi:hypothetical protein